MDEIAAESSFYAWLLIGKARHVLFKAGQKELIPYNITVQQAYVLSIIDSLDHKATLAELAGHLDRGVNTVSMLMTRMEKDGFVKKIREVPKSTLIRFELTEKGINTFNEINEGTKLVDTVMSVLSEEERQQLISMLEKIISKAEHIAVNNE